MIPSKTTEELNTLAADIYKSQVFTDRHLPHSQSYLLNSIFMVIGLGGLSEETAQDLGMLYEYLDKAGPRSINGYPCFFSVNMLNLVDAKFVWDKYAKIKETVEGVVSDG